MSEGKINKTHNTGKKITYSSSGVNIEKANDLINDIKPIAKKTQRPGADTKTVSYTHLTLPTKRIV